jgi:group I intron endonuclease
MKRSVINSVIEAPCGVYEIRNTVTDKMYVGSTISLRTRWNRHLNLLRAGRHDNIHLQRAWNLDGPEAFAFSVLEYVKDATGLIAAEQSWFRRLDACRHGYNLQSVAGSRLGLKHSQETKDRIRAAMLGRVVSQETRALMSLASRGRRLPETAKATLSAKAKARYSNKRAQQQVGAASAT